jgi:hypothetical protein
MCQRKTRKGLRNMIVSFRIDSYRLWLECGIGMLFLSRIKRRKNPLFRTRLYDNSTLALPKVCNP